MKYELKFNARLGEVSSDVYIHIYLKNEIQIISARDELRDRGNP